MSSAQKIKSSANVFPENSRPHKNEGFSSPSGPPADRTLNQEPLPFVQELERFLWRSPLEALRLGVGCAWLGRRGKEYQDEEIATLEAAFRLGGRYFDTSPKYGESEVVLGRFLTRVPRQKVFVASKIAFNKDRIESFGDWMEESVERSSQRLGLETIDLIQLHDMGIRQFLEKDGGASIREAAYRLKRAGKIRYFGLATRPHEELLAAIGSDFIDSVLSFGDCAPIDSTALAVAREATVSGKVFINGSPLCSGLLDGADPALKQVNPSYEERRRRAKILYDVCQPRDISILAAAIHFPLRHSDIAITLTGPRSVNEITTTYQCTLQPPDEAFWRLAQQTLTNS